VACAAASVRTMAEQVEVSEDIRAPADRVWAMVSDLTRMGEWSPENAGARWLGESRGPTAGARFRGVNRHGKKRWSTSGRIIDAQPGRLLVFRTRAAGLPVAEWRYEFESVPNGCRVTETWVDQRGRVIKALGMAVTGVTDRAGHNRSTMEETLRRLKLAAEGSSG
jgi:uncharacterized protein YndB with AHSA1/START domain